MLMKRFRLALALAPALLFAGCSSGSSDARGSTTSSAASSPVPLPDVSAERIAGTVTRSATLIVRMPATITKCGRRMDDCTAADQRLTQSYLLAVVKLGADVKVFQGSKRVPASVQALLDQTGLAAGAVVALNEPDARVFTCGPGSSSWPDGRDACEQRYQALARAALKLNDTLARWSSGTG